MNLCLIKYLFYQFNKALSYFLTYSDKFLGKTILNLIYKFPLFLVPTIGIPSPTTSFNYCGLKITSKNTLVFNQD